MNHPRDSSFGDYLTEVLKDPVKAAAYIEAAIELDDPAALLVAIRHVAQAHGMAEVTRHSGMNEMVLFRSLSSSGNPTLSAVHKALHAMGLRLSVKPRKDVRAIDYRLDGVRRVEDFAELLIESTESGDAPEAALDLLGYFVDRALGGHEIDQHVVKYLAEALKDGLSAAPDGPTIARKTFAKLGLIRSSSGRPRVAALGKVELDQEVARLLAAGAKHAKIQADLALKFDLSEETVRASIRDVIARCDRAVRQAAVADDCSEERPLVGSWLDLMIDACALEIGVDREIVEAVARRAPPFRRER